MGLAVQRARPKGRCGKPRRQAPVEICEKRTILTRQCGQRLVGEDAAGVLDLSRKRRQLTG